jgi:MFS family permease
MAARRAARWQQMWRAFGTGMNETIADRIDALPLGSPVWRVLLLAGVAWLIESYDIGIIGSALPTVERQYALGSVAVGIVVAASTLGIVAALLPGGRIADRIGRKPVLIAGAAWSAIFTMLTGFARDPHTIIACASSRGLGWGRSSRSPTSWRRNSPRRAFAAP